MILPPPQSLKSLNVSKCDKLNAFKLAPLGHLTGLTRLDAANLVNMTPVPDMVAADAELEEGLGKLTNLKVRAAVTSCALLQSIS